MHSNLTREDIIRMIVHDTPYCADLPSGPTLRQKLPEKIHFVYVNKPLPDKYKENILSFRQFNPQAEVILWVDDHGKDTRIEGVTVRHISTIPDFLNADLILIVQNPAEKADIIRVEVVYNFGGIYADTDSHCVRPLTELFKGGPFLGPYINLESSHPWMKYVVNGVFGFAPHDPWLNFVRWCMRHPNALDNPTVNERTGPVHISSCLWNRPDPGISLIDGTLVQYNTGNPDMWMYQSFDHTW